MDETKYSLQHKETGKLIKVIAERNAENAEGVDVSYSFANYGDTVWTVKDAQHAEFVRTHDTPWYNAGYDTPSHSNTDMDEYTVVKMVTTIVPVHIEQLADKDIAIIKYGPEGMYPSPIHLEEILERIDAGLDVNFSLYDYQEVDRYLMGKKNV